jgi:hypothetical protein
LTHESPVAKKVDVQESEGFSRGEEIKKLKETLNQLEALAEKVRGLIAEAEAMDFNKKPNREGTSVDE